MIAPIMLAFAARRIENKAAKAEYGRMTVLPWWSGWEISSAGTIARGVDGAMKVTC
ncbi:MAG: hypothetical protein WAU79_08650 [Bradyrhizobium sp.]|jgi:hypothetical protein|uniref:hypothetical protein n=1 Tax=Bradyrhizobium sp. TaxID=376 RepID=UPI003BAEAD5A